MMPIFNVYKHIGLRIWESARGRSVWSLEQALSCCHLVNVRASCSCLMLLFRPLSPTRHPFYKAVSRPNAPALPPSPGRRGLSRLRSFRAGLQVKWAETREALSTTNRSIFRTIATHNHFWKCGLADVSKTPSYSLCSRSSGQAVSAPPPKGKAITREQPFSIFLRFSWTAILESRFPNRRKSLTPLQY